MSDTSVDIFKEISKLIANEDASKLCPILTSTKDFIKSKTNNKPPLNNAEMFKLPVPWRKKDDFLSPSTDTSQVAFTKTNVDKSKECSCTCLRKPLTTISDDRNANKPLNVKKVKFSKNPALIMSDNESTICTCPKVPLPLIPQDVLKPPLIKCQCHDILSKKAPTPYNCLKQKKEMKVNELLKKEKPIVLPSQDKQTGKRLLTGSDKTCPCCHQTIKTIKPQDVRQRDKLVGKTTSEETTSETSTNSSGSEGETDDVTSQSTATETSEEVSKVESVDGDEEKSSQNQEPQLDSSLDIAKRLKLPPNQKKKLERFIVLDEKDCERFATIMNVEGMYPGWRIGHKKCVLPPLRVPPNMGWLWNLSEGAGKIKPGLNWRPGAIRQEVKMIMDKRKGEDLVAAAGRLKKNRANKKKIEKSNDTSDGIPLSTVKKKVTFAKPIVHQQKVKTIKEQTQQVSSNKPTLKFSKTKGQYFFKVNAPNEDGKKDGNITIMVDPRTIGSNKGPGRVVSTTTVSDDSLEMQYVSPYALYKNRPLVPKRNAQTLTSRNRPLVPKRNAQTITSRR